MLLLIYQNQRTKSTIISLNSFGFGSIDEVENDLLGMGPYPWEKDADPIPSMRAFYGTRLLNLPALVKFLMQK